MLSLTRSSGPRSIHRPAFRSVFPFQCLLRPDLPPSLSSHASLAPCAVEFELLSKGTQALHEPSISLILCPLVWLFQNVPGPPHVLRLCSAVPAASNPHQTLPLTNHLPGVKTSPPRCLCVPGCTVHLSLPALPAQECGFPVPLGREMPESGLSASSAHTRPGPSEC